MPGHSTFDQTTLLDLWKLVRDCDIATKGHRHSLKNIYIRTQTVNGQKCLCVRNENGGLFSRFIHWCSRSLNHKSYTITNDSSTTWLLRQLHDKMADLSESALMKAISTSTIVTDGLSENEVLTQIKIGCRRLNHILQHIMERKVEKALESRQEAIVVLFSGLFLPNWDLADARKAEIQRAADELRRAQSAAKDMVISTSDKIQGYLDAACAQLNVAMTGKEEAEHLLKQAKSGHSIETLDQVAQKANECANDADQASIQVAGIIKQADELVKTKEKQPNQPILNFGEIEELKKFREIVNVVGQVAEYAQSARNLAAEVAKLALKI